MKNKLITTIILMIIILNYILINISHAQICAQQTLLYSKGNYSGILEYDEQDLTIEHVVYEYEGVEYPAYSLSYLEEGINTNNSYTVNIEQCEHLAVWEILYYGYPYKTPKELGCMGEIESYIATELASACILGYKDVNKLTAINEQGQRILNAIYQIINTVITTEITKPMFNMYVTSDNVDWITDENDSNYISKTYSVTHIDCEYEKATPRLYGDVPAGTIITNINNQETQTFEQNEKFKILLPINSLDRNSNFILDVLLEGKAYTVLQGTPLDNTQRVYMLSTDKLENVVSTILETYLAQSTYTPIPEDNSNNQNEDIGGVNKYIETECVIKDKNNATDGTVGSITNNTENKEVNNVITNVINSEMIDVVPIIEYMNEINRQNNQLQARVIEQEKTIENITKQNNITSQKEIVEESSVKKLPRTGY